MQASRGGGRGRGGKPRQATYKMVISKWYKKSIKTFQKTLKTASVGRCIGQALQVPVELPYAPEVCPGGQDTASPPL